MWLYFWQRWLLNTILVMSVTILAVILTPDRYFPWNLGWLVWLVILSGVLSAWSTYRWRQQTRDIQLLQNQYRALVNEDDSAPVLLAPTASLYELSQHFNQLQQTIERRQHKYQRQVANYQTMLDNLPVGVLTVDYQHKVVDVNRAAWELLDRPKTTLPVNENQIFRHFSLLDIVRQTFETRQNAQSVLSLPINGQMRQLEVTTLLHQAPSARDEVIVLLYDLTTLLALERMQADFLANASHEFKTPLTAINGFVETLQGPAGEDSAVREQFLGIIENEAHRMTDLVNDVLSLSRIHYGEAGQDVSVVNLADFINEAWQSIQESAAHKDITFTNHVPRDLTVTISNGALKTLLANLLTNAVKYNQVGGQVIVNADMDLQHWTLRIEDTGIGIPKSQQNRVFERFYRGDASRQRRIADGTGLGLAIVQELVQQLNGQIQLQSQVGVGTTFQVTLPKI